MTLHPLGRQFKDTFENTHTGEKFSSSSRGDLVRSEDEIAQGSLLPNVNASCNLLHLSFCSCYVPLHVVRKLAEEENKVKLGGFHRIFLTKNQMLE